MTISAFSSPVKSQEAPPFAFSPSIKASPVLPKAPHAYHDAEELLANVKMKEIKGFAKKYIHSLAITDSTKKQGQRLAFHAEHLSMCAKQLELHPENPPPPLVLEPGVEAEVIDEKSVVVRDTKKNRTREFGIHRQETVNGTHKSWYPKSGDGILVAKQGDDVTPKHLLEIVKEYRASPTGDPREFAKRKIEKLL